MRIFVVSRYAGDIEGNTQMALRFCREIARAGHAPFAPHLLYPRFLDEHNAEERAQGIGMGLAWMAVCDEVWAYVGDGISAGMTRELSEAQRLGKPVRMIERMGDVGR